jgi:hypothetical protein
MIVGENHQVALVDALRGKPVDTAGRELATDPATLVR